MSLSTPRIFISTMLALTAFAGNSVLCRLALGQDAIDAASFTNIRLVSGILVLALIARLRLGNNRAVSRGSNSAAFMLFMYAAAFSYAYISLDTGTGALILFGSVQITMILVSLFSGHRLHGGEWAGILLAFSGFVYLILPGVSTPSMLGFVLMTAAGVAWGFYTLKGRGSKNPLLDTAFNFARTWPYLLLLFLFTFREMELSTEGVLLAVVSGALASGVGYSIWYSALGGLTATQAAVLQLLVPVIAAMGGVMFSGETLSLRLLLSSVLVLGGIVLVIWTRTVIERRRASST